MGYWYLMAHQYTLLSCPSDVGLTNGVGHANITLSTIRLCLPCVQSNTYRLFYPLVLYIIVSYLSEFINFIFNATPSNIAFIWKFVFSPNNHHFPSLFIFLCLFTYLHLFHLHKYETKLRSLGIDKTNRATASNEVQMCRNVRWLPTMIGVRSFELKLSRKQEHRMDFL